MSPPVVPAVHVFAVLGSGDSAVGGAFAISARHVVTALHCLPRASASAESSAEPTKVSLRHEFAGRIEAQLCQAKGDFALLEILAFGQYEFWGPSIVGDEELKAGEPWHAPYKPADNDAKLTGEISESSVRYECTDGSVVSAAQLNVSQYIGNHGGYSGGPTVQGRTDAAFAPVFGLLLEQLPDRVDHKRAANVVFALNLADALGGFSVPPFGLPIAAASGATGLEVNPTPAGELMLRDLHALMVNSAAWEKDEVASADCIKALIVRVADGIIQKFVSTPASLPGGEPPS